MNNNFEIPAANLAGGLYHFLDVFLAASDVISCQLSGPAFFELELVVDIGIELRDGRLELHPEKPFEAFMDQVCLQAHVPPGCRLPLHTHRKSEVLFVAHIAVGIQESAIGLDEEELREVISWFGYSSPLSSAILCTDATTGSSRCTVEAGMGCPRWLVYLLMMNSERVQVLEYRPVDPSSSADGKAVG